MPTTTRDHVATIKKHTREAIAVEKADLVKWMERRAKDIFDPAVTIALLETAIERELDLLGDEADARMFINATFDQVVKRRRGTVQ